MVSELQPDVVTIAVEMPEIYGITTDRNVSVELLKTWETLVSARNKDSCAVYGMSKAIVDANLAARVFDLDGISGETAEL